MDSTVSVRRGAEEVSPAPTIEFIEGGRQWRVARPHATSLESGGIDWYDLAHCPTATLVKRNSHRDVWRVRCAGRDYFAKLYHPNGTVSQAKLLIRGATALREWNVGRYAAAHSIATVVPVATAWIGSRGARGTSLLITEAVTSAEPLNEYWLRIRDDRPAADEVTALLARLIARAHQCGFQHGDMHPGNILIRPNGRCREAFFVDLHNVRVGRPVGHRAVVANLAQLNQWFRRHATRTQRRRFLKLYIAYRDQYAQASPFSRNLGVEPAALMADLAVQADRHAEKLWAKRDRRTRRSGKYFARIRPAPGWHGHVLLCSKHPAPTACAALLTYTKHQWMCWLQNPLFWIDRRRHELLKDSHTAMVCMVTLPVDAPRVTDAVETECAASLQDGRPILSEGGGRKVIVKRPLARNLWKRLGHVFGRSRNLRSWRMANMLLNRDVPTAQPLAVVERYAAGIIRLDSIGLTDYVADSADLETFLTRDVAALDQAAQRRVKNRLIDTVVLLLRRFHDRGFVHRDLKAPNLLVNWEPPYNDAPRLTFIDMDGISHVRRPTGRHNIRAVVRLCVSLLGCRVCTHTDRLRFLRRHLTSPGRTPSDWKTQWRAIQDQVHAKVQDKEARRLWKLEQYGRE